MWDQTWVVGTDGQHITAGEQVHQQLPKCTRTNEETKQKKMLVLFLKEIPKIQNLVKRFEALGLWHTTLKDEQSVIFVYTLKFISVSYNYTWVYLYCIYQRK